MSEQQSSAKETITRSGELTIVVEAEFPEKVKASGDDVHTLDNGLLVVKHRNSYVRSGLRNSLLREYTPYVNATAPVVTGSVVGYIGVDNDSSAVTYDTQFLHGSAAGTATTTIILPFSPNASIVTDGTGVVQVVTAGATFTNSSFTSGVFAINKVGFLLAATDATGNLVDVIGGSGTAPYSRAFSLNLTSAGTFTFTAQIAVTCASSTTG
jgi:hypothetical protein